MQVLLVTVIFEETLSLSALACARQVLLVTTIPTLLRSLSALLSSLSAVACTRQDLLGRPQRAP